MTTSAAKAASSASTSVQRRFLRCVYTCDKQVLGMSTAVNSKGYHYAYMANPEACIGCTNCGIICPDGVISVYRVKVEE